MKLYSIFITHYLHICGTIEDLYNCGVIEELYNCGVIEECLFDIRIQSE